MNRATARKSRVPTFRSHEEEAAFWDEHDSSEFEDEFKEVKLRFRRPLKHIIEIEGETLDRLLLIAESKGIAPVDLVQGWFKEMIERDSPAGKGRKH